MVGKAATVFEILIFVPVIAMVVLGLIKWHHNPFVPLVPPNQPFSKVFGVGLALGLWLYSGYEQLSTVAEEVENPAAQLSASACAGGAVIDCDVLSADIGGLGCGRQLAAVERWILLGPQPCSSAAPGSAT